MNGIVFVYIRRGWSLKIDVINLGDDGLGRGRRELFIRDFGI